MKLPCSIRFADEKLKDSFLALEKGTSEEQQLFFYLNKARDEISENAFCGIRVPRRLVPKEYVQTYAVENLWKYNLPGGWRLLYTITSDEILIIGIVLEWMNHNEYERRFRY